MEDKKKVIDLPPQEYRAEQTNEKHPFWGPGAGNMALYAVVFIFVSLVVRYFR